MSAKTHDPAFPDDDVVGTPDVGNEVRRKEALREAGALQPCGPQTGQISLSAPGIGVTVPERVSIRKRPGCRLVLLDETSETPSGSQQVSHHEDTTPGADLCLSARRGDESDRVARLHGRAPASVCRARRLGGARRVAQTASVRGPGERTSSAFHWK